MGKPITKKQLREALDLWGSWAHTDAVGRLDAMIADAEKDFEEAKRNYVPNLVAICEQAGVNPLRLVRDPDEVFHSRRKQIDELRVERDRVYRFMTAFESGIATLSPKQQQYLRARYVEMKSPDDICVELGMTQSQVYQLASAASRALRGVFTVSRRKESTEDGDTQPQRGYFVWCMKRKTL